MSMNGTATEALDSAHTAGFELPTLNERHPHLSLVTGGLAVAKEFIPADTEVSEPKLDMLDVIIASGQEIDQN